MSETQAAPAEGDDAMAAEWAAALAESRPEAAEELQGMVTVVEGLKPGEVIAEEGSFKLREGAAVRPPEAQASAGH